MTHDNAISVERYWQFGLRALRFGIFYHTLLAFVFYGVGAPWLALANLGGAALFFYCIHLVRQKYFGTVMILVRVEILAQVAAAVWVLGWNSGFHFYALVLPVLASVNLQRSNLAKLLQVVTLIILYISMDMWLGSAAPLVKVEEHGLITIRYFNIALSFAALGTLAHFYSKTVSDMEHRLHSMANTDALTGLSNRRHLLEIAAYELARIARTPRPLSIIICDIDHFKVVNDRHGHACGDRVLALVAKTVNSAVRLQDSVSRWGGEEFLVLLPETDLAAAQVISERIRNAVAAQQTSCDSLTLTVTLTLGVGEWLAGERFEDCIARADDALYVGKQSGRNRTEPLPFAA
jgi:diguanylate cyclase